MCIRDSLTALVAPYAAAVERVWQLRANVTAAGARPVLPALTDTCGAWWRRLLAAAPGLGDALRVAPLTPGACAAPAACIGTLLARGGHCVCYR